MRDFRSRTAPLLLVMYASSSQRWLGVDQRVRDFRSLSVQCSETENELVRIPSFVPRKGERFQLPSFVHTHQLHRPFLLRTSLPLLSHGS